MFYENIVCKVVEIGDEEDGERASTVAEHAVYVQDGFKVVPDATRIPGM